MVPRTWRAFACGRKVLPRKVTDLEQLRFTSELRSVLAATGIGEPNQEDDRSDHACCRLVGPGRLLWAHQGLRNSGKDRYQSLELFGGRSVESRWLESAHRRQTGGHR